MGYIYIYTYIYIYVYMYIYIYTRKISALSMTLRFSTLDFQDFCDFCERYQNYEREVGMGIFLLDGCFSHGICRLFPMGFRGLVALFGLISFFFLEKKIQGRRWGGGTFFSKSELKRQFGFQIQTNNHSRNCTGRLGIGSSWILPSATFPKIWGEHKRRED